MQSTKVRLVFQQLAAIAGIAMLAACGGGGDSAPVPPSIDFTQITTADVGLPYTNQLAAGGSGPFKWEVVGGGPLPTGLTLSDGGELAGTATAEAEKNLSLKVTGPGGTVTKDNIRFVVRGVTSRVSVVSETLAQATGGGSGDVFRNGRVRSSDPGVNNTGRYVVFDSAASNIIPGQTTNGKHQVYLHDRQTGKTELISVATDGSLGNDDSVVAVVSDDGNFVAWDSWASNLVNASTNGSNDTNNSRDVFLRNRATKTTIRVSQGVAKAEGLCPAGVPDGETCNSFDPSISADGKVIAFGSLASLELADNDTEADIYVLNLRSGSPVLTRVSAGAGAGSETGSPAISADGNFLVFASKGFDGGTVSDVFLANLTTAPPTLKKVSVAPGGGEANGSSFNPSINGDGTVVAFASLASDWGSGGAQQQIFVATNVSAVTPSVSRVSVASVAPFAGGDGNSDSPVISRDGKYVAYESEATNLDVTSVDTNGASDIYLLQRGVGSKRISNKFITGGGSVQGDQLSRRPAITEDGGMVAYYSDATTLVDGDTNAVRDAFVTRRQ